MRRAVALLVVGALVFAGVPVPVGGVHESDGNIGVDDRHGDLFVPSVVDTTLFLHCTHTTQAEGLDTVCNDGGNKTFQAAGLEDEPDTDGITDDVSGDVGEDTSLIYSFRRARDNGKGVFKSGTIEGVTATLFIENLISSGDFHVEFFINDDKVGESGTESITTGSASEVTFDVPIDNGTQPIEPGDKLKLKIVGDGSWNLHLHSKDDPSRVTITGELLRTRSWLEPPDGGTRSSFDLTGSDAERSFQPLMSVRTALGISTIWPVDAGSHKHGGGIKQGQNAPDPTANLFYNPTDPGIGSSNPISDDPDCQDPDTPDASNGLPTELHWDRINSSARFPTLHLHRESGADVERCVIDRDTALAGNWSFDFELPVETVEGLSDIPMMQCSGGPCVQEVPVELIEGPAFALSLDEDDGFKEVLSGETVHYNLRLRNRLASEQTFDLAVDGPGPEDWTATLSDDQVTISGGGSVSLDLAVTVPESASINADATTTVTASAPGFDDTKSVAVTTFVGDAPTFDASAFDAESSAGLGERATFLTKVTNDGNTRETLALSVQGVPGDLSVSLPRSTVTLDAGERDQVRVHVDVPEDVSEELLDATQTMQLSVRSTSADRVVGNGTLRLNILASYGFEANVFHPTHQVRTANGTPESGVDRPCTDSVGNTTYGSYYRVILKNTGGLADEIDVTNITPVQADGENPDNWHAAAYPGPVTTPSEDKQIDGPVPLPAGHSKVQFFVLVYREDRDDDDDGTQDQCQATGGDPWEENDVVSVGADLISRNQPGLRRTVNLRLEAEDPEFEPGVKLERHLYADTDGDGFNETLDIPQPRPMPPGETQQLEFRLTNTGNFGCFNAARFDERQPPYRAFLTGVPWAPSFDPDGLQNFSWLKTGRSGVDPPPGVPPTGDDGGDLNVTYDNRLLQMNLTVDEQAEAGQTFKARLHVEAICDIPHLENPDTKMVSDSIPVEFVVTEETGMEVTTDPADGEVEVLPGREALVNVVVENAGSTRPTHNLSIASSSLPSGWEARIAGQDSLQVPPLSRGIVPVAIETPADAAPGDAGSVDIQVTASESDLQQTVPVGARVVDRGDLAIAVDSEVKAVEPGGVVRYNVTLTNEGTVNVTVDGTANMTIKGVPSGWQANLVTPDTGTVIPEDPDPEDRAILEPGESLPPVLELQAPADELAASTVGTTVVWDKPPNGTVAASVQTHVASQFGVDLSAVPASLAVRPRDSAQFDLRVHNQANGVDTIDLAHEDPPEGWSVTIPKDRRRLVLGAQETTSVPVTVDPPDDAPPGLTVPLQFTATSATRSTATDRITLSTTVASYDPEIRADPSPRRIGPGQATNFPITVVNNGTGTDTIKMSATALPQGWRVEFSQNPIDLRGGETADLTVKVVPSRTATARSDNVVIVQARSSFAPGKTDAVTFEVAIADYLSRDVDGDGIEEAAVDTDENIANGYERFRDTDRRNGIVSGEVASFDGDGDGKPDFYVDITGDGAPDIFWSPVADIVTETTTIDVDGNGVDDYLADADGDETIDAVYLPDDDDVGPATSLDVDGDLEPEYLADSTGDDRLDRYVDTGDPRPGYMVRTATAFVSEGSYAVDTDGDGSHDTIVDTQGRTARTFTLADAALRLVSSYWYTIVLFAIVIVLFGAVRLAPPRQRYVYEDYDD